MQSPIQLLNEADALDARAFEAEQDAQASQDSHIKAKHLARMRDLTTRAVVKRKQAEALQDRGVF